MKKIHANFLEPSQEQLNSLLELYQTGKYTDAEKLSVSITEEFPKHPFAWKVLAVVLKQMGKINESLVASQKSTQLNPQDAEAYNNLGIILKELGRLKEAEASFRQAITLKPDHAEARYNLGNTLKELGRLNEAEASFRQVITLKPDYAGAYNNLGIILKELGRLKEAEASYTQAITLKADFAKAYNNLGIILKELGRLKEAEASYRQAITLKPDYAEAYSNLGVMLQELGRLKEAEASYRQAIALKPDYAGAHSNLGVMLQELGRLDEAEVSLRQAITLKPDNAEARYNLGNTLQELGRLDEAEVSYRQAIELKPDYAEAWSNIFFSLQAIKLQSSSLEYHLPLLDEQVNSKFIQIEKSILSYRLNRGSPTADKSLKEALNILSSTDNTFVKNPKVPSSELITGLTPSKKITALVHFGRSGTGLLHSLIDGHPEVSTLPSNYFSEFFDHFTWKKITAGGWEEMADRFATIYDVLFDASSIVPIASKNLRFTNNRGQKEGMTTVGEEKNEILSVDKKVFVKELKQLMDCHDRLDQFTFFKLVHSAYDKALNDHNKKNLIFYHIHNPDNYAQLNFLRLAPNTNWLMMVREPIQCCESWVNKVFPDSYRDIAGRIFQMLFEVDHAIYQNDKSIGVRLEDLKEHPKKTIQALCDWLDIKENDSLFQMTAQGKKWWGDPSSPDYSKEAMSPFGKTSIRRKLGSVFSENDQFILRTLFYPFSVRFNYVEENLQQFKNDLQTIRPMLNQMFDFEKKIIEKTKGSVENFMQSGPYLYLRSGMIERWNTLNTFHTYPNMLTLLKIN
jgi:Flp pilus assembly protein TadD